MFGPALWRLYLRLQSASPESLPKSPLAKALVSATRARMTEAQQRPQMMLWALRTAALQEHEAGDPAGALQTISQLRSLVPQHPALLGLDETLFTTAWRAGHALQLIERELASDPDFDSRFALLLQAGEQLEAQKQPAEAAKRFAAALELRPAHPVARAGLVRSYLTAGNLDALDQLTRIELKEATDVQTRVAAYERQALIATLRGGNPVERSEAIMNAYRSILNVDANNHSAMRALERHYIAHENWGDLTHLYEQMGLVASDTAFSVHIHLDRARLRQKLAWQDKVDPQSVVNQIENDYRLALFRDRHCRPALRTLLDAALRRGELGHVAELSVAMAQLSNTQLELLGEPSEAQSAAVFYVRAAEAMAQLGRSDEEVVATYRSALKKYPGHLPALRGLLHYAVVCKDFAAVADSAQDWPSTCTTATSATCTTCCSAWYRTRCSKICSARSRHLPPVCDCCPSARKRLSDCARPLWAPSRDASRRRPWRSLSRRDCRSRALLRPTSRRCGKSWCSCIRDPSMIEGAPRLSWKSRWRKIQAARRPCTCWASCTPTTPSTSKRCCGCRSTVRSSSGPRS